MTNKTKLYKTYPIEINGDFLWRVEEIQTQNIMKDFEFRQDAIKSMKFWGNNGGFSGWTPAYIFNGCK